MRICWKLILMMTLEPAMLANQSITALRFPLSDFLHFIVGETILAFLSQKVLIYIHTR
jgi:hypothetical protein